MAFSNKMQKAGSSFVKLCDAFELVAHTRTVEGDDWGIWIKFNDADGTPHDLVLASQAFDSRPPG